MRFRFCNENEMEPSNWKRKMWMCACVRACVTVCVCVRALSKSTIADSYMCGCPCIAYGSAIAHETGHSGINHLYRSFSPNVHSALSLSAWVRSFGFICWCWQLMWLLFVHKKVNAGVDVIIGQNECHSIFHFVPLKVFDYSFVLLSSKHRNTQVQAQAQTQVIQ